MATKNNQKIRDMVELLALTGKEMLPLAREGKNYKVTTKTLSEYIGSTGGGSLPTDAAAQIEQNTENIEIIQNNITSLSNQLGNNQEEIDDLGQIVNSQKTDIQNNSNRLDSIEDNILDISGDIEGLKSLATTTTSGLMSAQDKIDLNTLMVFYEGTDTDSTINSWKELEKFLEDFDTTKDLSELLSVKADKATTLAGYGITDAKIVDDIITLGDSTITPLLKGSAYPYTRAENLAINKTAVADRWYAVYLSQKGELLVNIPWANDIYTDEDAKAALSDTLKGYVTTLAFQDYAVQIQQNSTNITNLTETVDKIYEEYITWDNIPTKTSQLTNDSGFLTSQSLDGFLEDYAKKSGYSALKVLATDSSGNIVAHYVSTDKLGYLSNVTSDIQAQINALSIPSLDGYVTNDALTESLNNLSNTYLSFRDGGTVSGATTFSGGLSVQNSLTLLGVNVAAGSSGLTFDGKIPMYSGDAYTKSEADKEFHPLTTVDTAPTINSSNLVTSGGVAKAVADLAESADGLYQRKITSTNKLAYSLISGTPKLATVATSGSYNDLTNKPTIPSAITESTVSGWGFTKNTGTITGIKMNGASKGTSGVVDLGTVLTSHQTIHSLTIKNSDESYSLTYTPNSSSLSITLGKSWVGLGNVENKSSATIRGEITSSNVTTALGYTPYNSANFTKANIKSTLGISDWALASSKPTYTAAEVGALPSSTTIPSKGTVTGWGFVTADDVAAELENYLPLSGGTITGEFGALSIKRNNAYASAIRLENTSGVLGYIGFNDDYNARLWDKNQNEVGVLIHSGNISDYTLAKDSNGTVSLNGNLDIYNADSSIIIKDGAITSSTYGDTKWSINDDGIGTLASIQYNRNINSGSVSASDSYAWYTVYSCKTYTHGDCVILHLSHSYYHINTEAITLVVNIGYSDNAHIAQIGYNGQGGRAFQSARVRIVDNEWAYIDINIYNAFPNTDAFFVNGSGRGEFQSPTPSSNDGTVAAELSFSPGNMAVQGGIVIDGNSVIHSGNISSYAVTSTTLNDFPRLNGTSPSGASATGTWGIDISGSAANAEETSRFKLVVDANSTNKDLNTNLFGGGLMRNYNSYSSSIFENAPSGMSYGCVLELSASRQSSATDDLSGQLAWDINHRGTDSTRNLWWRANDDRNFSNAQWHQIAFTDSTVAAANKLVTSGGINALTTNSDSYLYDKNGANVYQFGATGVSAYPSYQLFGTANGDYVGVYQGGVAVALKTGNIERLWVNSSGNVTIGSSDLAGTRYKLYVNGEINITNNYKIGGLDVLRVRTDHLAIGEETAYYSSLPTKIYGQRITMQYGTNKTGGFILNESGNVGIGTTSPTYKLDVNGTARVSSGFHTPFIELNANGAFTSNGGYLDFHFGGSSADYTTRIIEDESGKLSLFGKLSTSGSVRVGTSLEVCTSASIEGALTVGSATDYIAYDGSSLTGYKSSASAWSIDPSGNGSFASLTVNTYTYLQGGSTNPYLRLLNGGTNHYVQAINGSLMLGPGSANSIRIDKNGNVEIPKAFDVIYADGYVRIVDGSIFAKYGTSTSWEIMDDGSAYFAEVNTPSDSTKKNILSNIELTTSNIANAPAVSFTWKASGRKSCGTIAQYWKNVLPEVVSGDEGSYGMNYAVLGVVSSIILARNIETHEQRIARLEKEISDLQKELNALVNNE